MTEFANSFWGSISGSSVESLPDKTRRASLLQKRINAADLCQEVSGNTV